MVRDTLLHPKTVCKSDQEYNSNNNSCYKKAEDLPLSSFNGPLFGLWIFLIVLGGLIILFGTAYGINRYYNKKIV